MNEQQVKPRADLAREIVVVDRHLQAELRLLEQLDSLNQSLKRALDESGAVGVSMERSAELSRMADQLSEQSNVVKVKRANALKVVNATRLPGAPSITIREFIASLEPASQQRLSMLRETILDRLTEIHAMLVGNQAVMFYSYDFYRKMVSGLLDRDVQENQYSVKGQRGQGSAVKPGNLYRRVC